ncbi:MAG: hypothetical protein FWD87_05535 [Spirochaetaceae bacterium]|nr:hypothetical protein [Spirochaetaceae bacterium]
MKKYLLIALAIVIFATPVMASPTLSGTFRLGAIWDVQENNYMARFDRARLVLRSNVDDYNAVRFEMRGLRNRAGVGLVGGQESTDGTFGAFGTTTESALGQFGQPTNPGAMGNLLYVHTATVTTNWARYFGFEDSVGITTTVGYAAFGPFDRLSYTIWGVGGQGWETARDFGGRLDFNIMGIVRPYLATGFAAYNTARPSFIAGAGIDLSTVVEPVDIWLEAFFLQDGAHNDQEIAVTANRSRIPSRGFGVEAQVATNIGDDMRLSIGGVLDVKNKYWGGFYPYSAAAVGNASDEFATMYKLLAGFSVLGLDLGLAFAGGISDNTNEFFPTGKLGLSASYAVTNFLAVQAGAKFAMSDFKEKKANNETFLGAEFGVVLRPGRVRYDLGYLILNEDARRSSATNAASTYMSDTWGLGNTGPTGNGAHGRVGGDWKGGLMFTVNASF